MAPERDWSWLRSAAAVLRSRAKSVRNKRARLRAPHELTALGRSLMLEAEAACNWTALQRAIQFRDGLVIVLLAYRPLRLRNFAALALDRHLTRHGNRFWIHIPASETKSSRVFEAPMPEALNAQLERYLSYYRPILLNRGGRRAAAELDALWVSEVGTAMAGISIHKRIRKHTRAAFGEPVPPHWFRDAAATSIAIEDPLHVRGIVSILGHASLDTAEQHYIQARTIEASRRHLRVIADFRRGRS